MRVHVCACLCSHACAVSARGHARACLRAKGSGRPVPTVWGGTPEGSWPGRGDRGPGPGPGSGQGRRRRPRWQGAFFPGRKRCEGGGQVGIVLEKNMNYLSVTSRLAWRGAAAERPERQVRAAPAQSDPGAASRRAAGGLPAREPPSPPWARKGACGGSACRERGAKISLSMFVPHDGGWEGRRGCPPQLPAPRPSPEGRGPWGDQTGTEVCTARACGCGAGARRQSGRARVSLPLSPRGGWPGQTTPRGHLGPGQL